MGENGGSELLGLRRDFEGFSARGASRKEPEMTAKTSEFLAKELEKAGFPDLALKARKNYYHDFFSELATPAMELHRDLSARAPRSAAAREMLERHMNGEFEADAAESEEWARSPEGQVTFDRLLTDKEIK